MCLPACLPACLPVQLYNWYLRAMGSTVGKDVFCLGGVVAEYDQVSMRDTTVIDR